VLEVLAAHDHSLLLYARDSSWISFARDIFYRVWSAPKEPKIICDGEKKKT
jgi:hypothetical protein